jgi:hypothetical protein
MGQEGIANGSLCYVYGILPADARLPAELIGTGGGAVSLVRHGDLAGVISELPPIGALGTPEDLLAHERVVASLAVASSILPLRFGAMVTTREAVVQEMLEPYHEWFAAALEDLTGRAQFSVSGIYVQETVLREVVAEEPEALQLRESLRGVPEDAGYYDRVRLGELIVHALDAKREADTEELAQTLGPHAVDASARSPIGEDTAVDAAFLVADEERPGFEHAVEELACRWADRVRLRTLGPLAPYDFVPPVPEEL